MDRMTTAIILLLTTQQWGRNNMKQKLQSAIDCAELAVSQAMKLYYVNEGNPQDVENLQAWNQAKTDRTQAYANYNAIFKGA